MAGTLSVVEGPRLVGNMGAGSDGSPADWGPESPGERKHERPQGSETETATRGGKKRGLQRAKEQQGSEKKNFWERPMSSKSDPGQDFGKGRHTDNDMTTKIKSNQKQARDKERKRTERTRDGGEGRNVERSAGRHDCHAAAREDSIGIN